MAKTNSSPLIPEIRKAGATQFGSVSLPGGMALSLSREPRVSFAVAPKSNFHCNVRASFATAFSTWRRKNKVPLKKIAKDLGLAVSTVNSWELGERFPTGRNFEMLANYTGVPPCRLFCVMADKCVPTDCLLAMGRKS